MKGWFPYEKSQQRDNYSIKLLLKWKQLITSLNNLFTMFIYFNYHWSLPKSWGWTKMRPNGKRHPSVRFDLLLWSDELGKKKSRKIWLSAAQDPLKSTASRWGRGPEEHQTSFILRLACNSRKPEMFRDFQWSESQFQKRATGSTGRLMQRITIFWNKKVQI